MHNQKLTAVAIDGYNIEGFFSGAAATITYDGGEVTKTQGTDGPSVNIATQQGGTIAFTIRPDSPARGFLRDLVRRQREGAPGVTCIARDGAGTTYRMSECFVSNPGEISIGDKEQAGIQYTVVGMTLEEDYVNR